MLESKQLIDNREVEKCIGIDATVLARDVLLRTHMYSPYQHVFRRDHEPVVDVWVPGPEATAMTLPVLDRSSECVTQIRQPARQALVECQDDKAMRPALVARSSSLREFEIGNQVAFWQKGEGPDKKHGHTDGHKQAAFLTLCPDSENVWEACRHQLFMVSQEPLRRTSITERATGDVFRQELRASGEHSATGRQVRPKYLDISKDSLPPSAEKFVRTSPRERAGRLERFESRSSGHVQQENTVGTHNSDNGSTKNCKEESY